MTPNNLVKWALLGLLATGGCAASGGGVEPPRARPLGSGMAAFVAPEAPDVPTAGTPEEPSGELTLREALAQTLLNNPDLASFSWQVRAEEAEALQAGLRPNPEIGLQLENFGGSGAAGGFHGSETTIVLSQLMELGGERGKRRELALLERGLALWDYEARRLDVVTDATRAFVSVLAAQQRVQIAQELEAVAERFLETVARRVRAGAVSTVEETRARVALSTSRLELQTAEQQLAVERRRLSALWGSADPEFTQAVGRLDEVIEPVALEPLLEHVHAGPEVARWHTEIERRRADVALQRSIGTPNVAVVGGFRHFAESSDHAFIVGLEVPLPFRDRNQGARRAAGYRLSKTLEEQRSARVTAEAALAVAHDAWFSAYRTIQTLEAEILPDAAVALETAQDAYQRGLFRLTDVLDTQRTLFQLRSQRLDALEQYHHARSRIERLIGEALTEYQEVQP